jgi:hypothetical protein
MNWTYFWLGFNAVSAVGNYIAGNYGISAITAFCAGLLAAIAIDETVRK